MGARAAQLIYSLGRGRQLVKKGLLKYKCFLKVHPACLGGKTYENKLPPQTQSVSFEFFLPNPTSRNGIKLCRGLKGNPMLAVRL